jgi:chromosome segregation ATPase
MNQMEDLEQTNDTLAARLESSRQREIDLQAQIEQLDFDLDLLKRKSGNAPRDNDLLRDLQEQLQEREFEAERARTEATRMRHETERASQEVERLREQCEYQEQLMMQRDQERTQYQNQITDLKSKLQNE